MGSLALCIRFNKVDEFIKSYDVIRYLVVLDQNWFDKICNSIKYLISKEIVLQIVLIIILQESELTHIILYLLRKYWLS